ncbi:MAG: valine--tRNA ligase [Cytophagales bacterium]|nr:valine--tRNA ligase [Armatimonadota bacterium]
MELPIRYEPQAAEAEIYARWLGAGCFRALPDDREKRFCVTVPPPNVTGALHLGHALNHTIMDALGRWHRMRGYNTLILPGTDHAGIATQSVVERQIAKEGLTRQDLGREAFVARVWEWKNEYGDRIVSQLQRLGCGYDWDRLRFTMDEGYVDAILTVFERLYEKQYLYLGSRIVNWCPFHRTAISDIEVEEVEENGFLYHLRYPFADGSGFVTVATTRPETLFGDTAVAVNPADPRYEGLIGKRLKLPLTDREIPLIGDDYAQQEFGTGAVKVTPAHDANDFEAGRRNDLPQIVVIGPDGALNENAGPAYAGLDRFEARKRVTADLEAAGVLVKTEPYLKRTGRCDRCKTPIEPLLSRQWFCKMGGTEMVRRAIDAAATNEVQFVPSRYKEMYLRWMENLRDWPISRQLWWGHRMPLYRLADSDADNQASYVTARSLEEAARKLGSPTAANVVQVDDVLDTWFSSALWPFATLGWPQSDKDVNYYYPTSALFTAQEILYLWVARMIMTSEEFIGEKPFNEVYIHATILDEQGRRMSKSLGNGVDPLDLIDLYGADALRFALAREAGQRQDIRIKPIKDGRHEQVEQARNFANKIWNASRFALLNLEGYTPPPLAPQPTALVDRWILSRLGETARRVAEGLATYNLDDAARALYEFFWDDFCDWYIEAAKPRLSSSPPAPGEAAAEARHVLWFTLERTLRLLHPIMPYLTETIWQSLPGVKEQAGVEFLMQAAYPEAGDFPRDESAEEEWALVQEVTRAIRNLQAGSNLKKGGPAYFTPTDPATRATAQANAALIEFLTRFAPLTFEDAPGDALLAPTRYGDVRLPKPSVTEEEILEQRSRVQSDLLKIEKDLSGLTTRLSDPTFAARAPEAVVSKARQQAAELTDKRDKLTERLATLKVG